MNSHIKVFGKYYIVGHHDSGSFRLTVLGAVKFIFVLNDGNFNNTIQKQGNNSSFLFGYDNVIRKPCGFEGKQFIYQF